MFPRLYGQLCGGRLGGIFCRPLRRCHHERRQSIWNGLPMSKIGERRWILRMIGGDGDGTSSSTVQRREWCRCGTWNLNLGGCSSSHRRRRGTLTSLNDHGSCRTELGGLFGEEPDAIAGIDQAEILGRIVIVLRRGRGRGASSSSSWSPAAAT